MRAVTDTRQPIPPAPGSSAPDTSASAGDSPSPAAGRRGWRRARWVALWSLVTVVVLALTTSGLVVWSVRQAFPQHSGELAIAGLTAPVTVYRDGYGVPQLYAANPGDLFRAQGYVHAQDRFWEMDVRRHVTSGRLAELFGVEQVKTDAFLRTLGWRRVAEQEWAALPADVRGYLQAYADGVNAWLDDTGGADATGAKSLEYSVLGLSNSDYTVAKWDPIDSLAWLKAMAFDLRGNMGDEIDRATYLAAGLTREQVDELFPDYPYEVNRPIVGGGTVVKGAFDPNARAATPPATPRVAASLLADLASDVAELPHFIGDGSTGIGSNSWVISGSLTATGKPLLANDPHLSSSMPGIWFQVGLHCSCEFNVEGFSFAGVPGIIIGHNDRLAWGFTNLGPDVTDLYVEKIDGDRVFTGKAWVPLQTRTETINVAGGDPVTITVRSSGHGPLLSDRSGDLFGVAGAPPLTESGTPASSVSPAPKPTVDTGAPGVPAEAEKAPYAVALRWTALDPGHTIEAIFALDLATNRDQLRAAAAKFDVPSQNIIFADVDGNIGYQSPGRIPVRGKGDGRWPVPGWDPAYDWTGYIPFAELPTDYNPAEGWIVTANQAVVGPQYPHLLTHDWSYGYRSQRIVEMIKERAAAGKFTAEDIRVMQFDNRNSLAADLVPALLAVPATGTAATARDLLRGWDYQQPAQSPAGSAAAAAFFNATWRHLLLRTFDELPDGAEIDGNDKWWTVARDLLTKPTDPWWDDVSTPATESRDDMLSAAMSDAADELTGLLGDEPADWRWGELHTLTLTHQTLGKSGIAPVEWLFNRGPVEAAGGSSIVNATGWTASVGYEVGPIPSMRMIVDLSHLDNSRWVQLTGNSGHAFHPNYDDQVELWRTGANLPMRWDRKTIEAEATDTLTFTPTT